MKKQRFTGSQIMQMQNKLLKEALGEKRVKPLCDNGPEKCLRERYNRTVRHE